MHSAPKLHLHLFFTLTLKWNIFLEDHRVGKKSLRCCKSVGCLALSTLAGPGLAPSPVKFGQCRCQGTSTGPGGSESQTHAARTRKCTRLYKASVHKKKAIEGLDWKAVGTHDGKEREAQRSGMQGLWMQFLTPWNNASAGSIQQPSISKTCNWGAGKPSVIFTEYSKPPGFYALFAEHNLPSSNAFFAIPMEKLPKCNEETSLW